jgi:hypothetical protein
MSRSLDSDGQGRGGRIEHWLVVRVLRNHRRVRLHNPTLDVGVGDTPSIRGRKKETPNKSMVAPLNLGGSLTNKRHPTLDPFGFDPSNSLRMYGLMHDSTPLNRS